MRENDTVINYQDKPLKQLHLRTKRRRQTERQNQEV